MPAIRGKCIELHLIIMMRTWSGSRLDFSAVLFRLMDMSAPVERERLSVICSPIAAAPPAGVAASYCLVSTAHINQRTSQVSGQNGRGHRRKMPSDGGRRTSILITIVIPTSSSDTRHGTCVKSSGQRKIKPRTLAQFEGDQFVKKKM